VILELEQDIFKVEQKSFESVALQVFRYQYVHVPVYNFFCNGIKRTPENTHALHQIPFLPIRFFKSHDVLAEGLQPQAVFTSSGTTGSITSRHQVAYTSLYEQSFTQSFRQFYGPVEDYCILALLPSYLERSGSSLVYMAEKMIAATEANGSGFFLYDFEKLKATLEANEKEGRKTLLLGVTYALLDFAEYFQAELKHTIIMETGGMKGKREEMTRGEVHRELMESFGVGAIHSEYGMTELLSQGYSTGNGIFHTPQWMKIMLRDTYNPLAVSGNAGSGAINIIDLANLYSCAFIATDDAGKLYRDGSFEVLGRLDAAEVRGCNLMYDAI
jgi:phenylacetate-coenzyme A ligase PaaK-like adenylate-forming protein